MKKTLVSNNKFKPLSFGLKGFSGRNNTGKIVTRHRGSATKKNYISVDFKRRFSNNIALCINLKYDANRTGYLALLKYFNGVYSYILAPQGLFNGYIVRTPRDLHFYYKKYKIGFCVFVYTLPVNSVFFNIELEPGKGGKYIRAAGTFGLLIRKDFNKKFIFVKLPTGKLCILTWECLVTLGRTSNYLHNREFITRAGINRNKGIRPTVRGVAMNPVDHPHGGRTKTVSPEVTPWGKIAKHNR